MSDDDTPAWVAFRAAVQNLGDEEREMLAWLAASARNDEAERMPRVAAVSAALVGIYVGEGVRRSQVEKQFRSQLSRVEANWAGASTDGDDLPDEIGPAAGLDHLTVDELRDALGQDDD